MEVGQPPASPESLKILPGLRPLLTLVLFGGPLPFWDPIVPFWGSGIPKIYVLGPRETLSSRRLRPGVAGKLPEVGSTALELSSLGGTLSLSFILALLRCGTVAKEV